MLFKGVFGADDVVRKTACYSGERQSGKDSLGVACASCMHTTCMNQRLLKTPLHLPVRKADEAKKYHCRDQHHLLHRVAHPPATNGRVDELIDLCME